MVGAAPSAVPGMLRASVRWAFQRAIDLLGRTPPNSMTPTS